MTIQDTFSDYHARTKRKFVDVCFRELRLYQRDYLVVGEGLENFLLAIDSAPKLEMAVEAVDAIVQISSFLENRGYFAVAVPLLESAIRIARSSGDEARLALLLSTYANLLVTSGEYDRAEIMLQDAMDMQVVYTSTELASVIYLRMGRLYALMGRLNSAYEVHLKALVASRTAGESTRLVTVLLNLGSLTAIRGNVGDAAQCYEEALTIAEESGNDRQLAEVLNNYGNLLFSRLKEHARARVLWERGLDVARRSGVDSALPMLLMNLGVAADNSGDHDLAEQYWLEGVAICRRSGNRAHLSILLSNLGFIELALDEYERAEDYMTEALSTARSIGHIEYICTSLRSLGALETARGDYDKSREYLQEGLELAKALGDPFRISMLLEEWGRLYLRQQEFERAYTALEDGFEQARRSNVDRQVAIVEYLLAQACLGMEKRELARHHGEASLRIFERDGDHWAPEVRNWLSTSFAPS